MKLAVFLCGLAQGIQRQRSLYPNGTDLLDTQSESYEDQPNNAKSINLDRNGSEKNGEEIRDIEKERSRSLTLLMEKVAPRHRGIAPQLRTTLSTVKLGSHKI